MINIQVLVVEDESVVALDICKKLIDMDYGVAALASTGEEAIHQAASTGPDLVLMDVKLAGTMSGIEAAGEIQRRFNIPEWLFSPSTVLLRRRYCETQTRLCIGPRPTAEIEQQSDKM